MGNERSQNPSIGILSAKLASVLTRFRDLEKTEFADRDELRAATSERVRVLCQAPMPKHRRLLEMAEDQVAREIRRAENGPTKTLLERLFVSRLNPEELEQHEKLRILFSGNK